MLVAHPDPDGRAALVHPLLGDETRVGLVAASGNSAEIIAAVASLRPAVVLVDERLATAARLASLTRASRVILLTGTEEVRALATMLLGPAHGCLVYGNFEPADLRDAVRAVADGLAWLSPVAAAAAAATMRAGALARLS